MRCMSECLQDWARRKPRPRRCRARDGELHVGRTNDGSLRQVKSRWLPAALSSPHSCLGASTLGMASQNCYPDATIVAASSQGS